MSTQFRGMKHGRRAAAWTALSLLGLAAAALIIPSCIHGDINPTPRTAVTSRSLTAGASNVPRTTLVTVKFNGPVLASTVTPSTFTLSDASGVVPSTVTFQPCNLVATLTPTTTLAPSTTYTVDLTSGIADPAGISITPDSFTFTTGASADITRPTFGGASSVTSPDVPTTTIPGSPTTIIPGTPVTTIPPTTIPTGPGTSVSIPGSSVTTPVPVTTPPPTVTAPTGVVTNTVSAVADGTRVLHAVATLSATVSWAPGSDDVDPASALVYDVFVSTMSGCYNFGEPSATTPPGATSANLPDLVLGVPYYFVVRARDSAGNEDQNRQEVALLPAVTPAVTFSNDVWPIVQARCQECHTTGVGAQQVPDMILSSPAETVAVWVNRPASCPLLPVGTLRVDPGHSATSFLWQKISSDVPPCGARMPLGAPPLSSLEQQTILSWIDQGANND